MKPLLPLASLVLLLSSSSAPAAEWKKLSGEVSGVVSRTGAVVRTPEEWAALWKEHDAGRGEARPEADFSKEMIVASWETPGGRYVMSKVPSRTEALQELKAQSEPKKGGWAVVVRFGPTLTDYSNTDIKVRTGRVNGVIKNAAIGERNDMNWYGAKGLKERPFHFIDEPSNDFTLGLENRKKGYAINLTARHPKFLVVEHDQLNQDVRFNGTVDGASVDRNLPANELFDHYRLTHRLMNYQLQVEKLFTVAEGKAGRLVIAPGIAAGAYFGYANAGYGDGSTAGTPVANGYLGNGISGSGRVSYEFHRVSASLAYQMTKAAMDYPFIDGSASHRLDSRALTLQVGLTLKK